MLTKTIAAAMLAIAGTQVSAETFTPSPTQQQGGNVSAFITHLEELNANGAEVRLDMDKCKSACTFYLSADNVCVGADSLFQFHGPSAGWTLAATFLTGIPVGLITHGMDDAVRAEVIDKMRSVYAQRWPALGDWFVENAAQDFGFSFVNVRGSSLNASFGIPLCEGDKK